MKLIILIPAHNEAKSIGVLVGQLTALHYECMVVDDGSIDGTGLIASQAGAIVLSTGKKSGKGAALRLGFAQIVKSDYTVALLMDGDGQHAPEDVDVFIKAYEKTGADIINGNRLNNPQGMPWLRLRTNRFMSWLISRICGQRVDDTQCGFRLITVKVLRAITLTCNDFEIETEILLKSAKKGFRFVSCDIKSIYRDEVSKIRPFKDTLRFIRYLIKEVTHSS